MMSSTELTHFEMETAALVAPVTALEFLHDSMLLTGEGPVLTVYRLQPRPTACAYLNVLQQYRIHGIRPRTFGNKEHGLRSTEPNSCDLAVFGGKAVQLVRIHDGEHLHLEVWGPLMLLQDWALDLRWLPGEEHSLVCVAVAHNSALLLDLSTGCALAQRSCLEGCLLYSSLLLVHECWMDTVLVGGTVFNQLVLWKPGVSSREGEPNHSDHKAPVERRLLGHQGVIFSIAYLPEKGWLASASDDRSVRLWTVGALGGPEGECGDLNPTCLMVLFGHQARVFSVHLSPGRLFSAGEDGSCLVWDYAGGGTVVHNLKGHRAGGIRALAISEGALNEETQEKWVATGGADGGVRLWRTKESKQNEEKLEETLVEKLTDLKFSGSGTPKVVRLVDEEHGSTNWSQTRCVVCTDQGTVYQFCNWQWEVMWQGTPEFQSYCVMELTAIRMKDSATKFYLCAVGNLSGSIQVFQIYHPQSGILLKAGSGKIHSVIWQEGENGVYLLASGADGLVYRWYVQLRLDENCLTELLVKSLPPFLLPPCAKRWLTTTVCLLSTTQAAMWVCGDRRGSLLLFQEGANFEQKSRDKEHTPPEENGSDVEGEIDLKERTERNQLPNLVLQPQSCLFGVHGKQGVTSICEYQGLFYSTGRDGCVRVFWINQTSAEKLTESEKYRPQLEILRVQRACKGMQWLERVLILKPDISEEVKDVRNKTESCYDTFPFREKLGVLQQCSEDRNVKDEALTIGNKGVEARFVILGFHAVHFVVWDPVRQERCLAVPCGGGHRSWSLWPLCKRVWPGYGALVFIKQGAVLASKPPGEGSGWAANASKAGGLGLREGIHGKGIGCVCRLGRVRGIRSGIPKRATITGMAQNDKDGERGSEGQWEILVTGGEDTTLTVLAIHPNSGRIEVLSVITDHISGVRTMAVVTCTQRGNKNQSLSALLVSASGRAQMQCYRLLISWDQQRLVPSCQVIQVSSHRLDEQWERRQNRHKTVKMNPETRYMSIAVVAERTDCHLLALACSDGAVRLFSVCEDKHQIDMWWETFYHQRCVLSVAACSLEYGEGNSYKLLFSAATDGKITVWDLTNYCSSSISTGIPPIPCLDIPAHQSGVNSLAVRTEKTEHQDDGCLVTVSSGGDDGQLTVSTIRVLYKDKGRSGGFSKMSLQTQSHLQIQLLSQLHVQLAHAAPLTALKFLSPGFIVTTSSDQRVCLWRVNSTGINHHRVLCSHVADAAGLDVWEGQVMEEEEAADAKRKTRFKSDLETSTKGGRMCQTGLEASGETGGRFTKEQEAHDKSDWEERVEAASETDEQVCEMRDEEAKVTFEPDSQSDTEREVNTDFRVKRSYETRRVKTWWVLVCGQGFQLVRVRNTHTGEETRAEGQRKKEKEWEKIQVTFQKKINRN